MSLINKVWIPNGKDNSFVNGYNKVDTMSNAEYAQWLKTDVTLTNEDVMITIQNNRLAGCATGVAGAFSGIVIGVGATILTYHLINRLKNLHYKRVQQAQAKKAE